MNQSSDGIRALQPEALWNHFADLNAVPRASKKEAKVIAFIKAYGEKLGLPTYVDQTGNVIIRKPASSGREDHPTVILQGHLDMVHQKNAQTQFDFETEGIRSYIDGTWVKAQGTTLGADNGIGVAAIMAILSSKDIPHPPIEALFTIDEETGMTGAKQLQEGLLQGKILLNLDSEEDDELTIGCAGGLDTLTRMAYREEALPAGYEAFSIHVRGLKGGHSGIEIHLGRANANKTLLRLLYKMHEVCALRLAEFTGGNLRNAIPREAGAIIAVPGAQVQRFKEVFGQRREAILQEYRLIEPDMRIELTGTTAPERVAVAEDQERMLRALYLVPNGVYRMSPAVPGLVETSNNLAKVSIRNGIFETQSLQRSSVESGIQDIANAVEAPFLLLGAEVEQSGGYPGWAPDPHSRILQLLVQQYERLYGEKPKVSACHAGLECGIIGQHYPGLDMISFGPTIKHPHSPDEKVHIPSVMKFWNYLCSILEAI